MQYYDRCMLMLSYAQTITDAKLHHSLSSVCLPCSKKSEEAPSKFPAKSPPSDSEINQIQIQKFKQNQKLFQNKFK